MQTVEPDYNAHETNHVRTALFCLLAIACCALEIFLVVRFLSPSDEQMNVVRAIDDYNSYNSAYCSFDDYSSRDGSQTKINAYPVLDNSVVLSEAEYDAACRTYDMALQGNKIFHFPNMSRESVTNIMDALGFTYAKATWKESQYGDDSVIVWEIDDSDGKFSEIMMERKLALDAIESAGITDGMEGIETVTRINDWLCENVEYDEQLGGHHAIDAFGGSAVCSGYSEAFRLMCESAGIPCSYIHGYTRPDSTPHAWNSVTIGGETYYCDITNNDSLGRNAYLLSDHLWSDHVAKYNEDGSLSTSRQSNYDSEGKDGIIYVSVPIQDTTDVGYQYESDSQR